MPIQHACFVSYCHGQGELTKRFVNELVEALTSSLEPYVDMPDNTKLVYHDEKRLLPGYNFNAALAEAVCQSLCMIAVFVPKYLDHDYCRRELEAMTQVAAARHKALGAAAQLHSYVIPVVFRGRVADLPPALQGHVHCCDLSGFTTADPKLTQQKPVMDEIERIARFVREVYVSMRKVATDCSTFVLPSSAAAGLAAIRSSLGSLRLTIHDGAHPRPVLGGVPFLGFVVFPERRRLKRRKGIHFRRRLRRLIRERQTDARPESDVASSLRGWINHVRYANTVGLRKALLREVWRQRADVSKPSSRLG